MRYGILTVTVLSLVVLSSGAMAKEKAKHDHKAPDPQAMMELYKQVATPGEPHKLLATLVGSWTTHSKDWMEPGKPPVESDGTVEMTMLLDGRFLHQDFHGDMMGQPYHGIGTTGYDNVTKQYETLWIDTMGTGLFHMKGTAGADGKTITMKGTHPEPGGGQMAHRPVWKIIDANHQTFEMYGTHGKGKGKEMKMMEIVYTRKP